jgi:hypothetical protein
MSDRPMDVDAARGADLRLLDLTAGMLEPGARSVPDGWQPPRPRTPTAAPGGPPGSPPGTRGPRRAEQPSAPSAPLSSDELLERVLAFSGTYVSDDGDVTVRRSVSDSTAYSAARYAGWCRTCAYADLVGPAGEPLADVRAAARFVATHDHTGTD